jgi:hypothetical protein
MGIEVTLVSTDNITLAECQMSKFRARLLDMFGWQGQSKKFLQARKTMREQ